MADGPWEKYQAPQQQVGPWQKYGATTQTAGADVEGMAEAAVRGTVAGVAGLPMSVLEIPGEAFSAIQSQLPEQVGGRKTQPYTIPGSTRSLLSWLPGEQAGERHPYAQFGGELVGTAIAPYAWSKAVSAATEVPRIASDVTPGGTARAAAKAGEAVGDVDATTSQIGDDLQTAVWNKIGNMNPGQSAQAMGALQTYGIDLSDSAALPEKVFATRDSVRLAKNLSSPQVIEGAASDYAASELDALAAAAKGGYPWSKARNIATAATQWQKANSDWLAEVPQTNSAVSGYIDYLARTAKTQKIGTVIGAAGAYMAGHGTAHEMARYIVP